MNIKSHYWSIIDFVLVVVSILFIGVILESYFFRIDLTEEKRYTLSQSTKNVLSGLQSEVNINIYLDGNLPPEFKKLQKAIKETLDEFKVYGGANIQYTFIEPVVDPKENASQKLIYDLVQKGIQPTNIFLNKDGQKTEKLIFPGAVISCKGEQKGFVFLKGAAGASSEESINQSIQGIEYEFISRIKDLSKTQKQKVGIVLPNYSSSNENLTEFAEILKSRFQVFNIAKVDLDKTLNKLDLLILIKPDSLFSDAQKLALDQYMVNGGKLLILIDKVQVNTNALGEDIDISLPVETNLDDLFFKWGFRVNAELIQDLQSGAMPIVVGNMGNQPQTQLMPWPYYPIFTTFGNHEIVKNSGAILGKYVNPIDTVKAKGIEKNVLFTSSIYNKVVQAPLKISLETVKKDFDPKNFQNRAQIVALLLEGKFNSMFTNRITEAQKAEIDFKSQHKKGSIVVVSDANICFNEISKNQIAPLGYDKYTGKKFANSDFLENTLSYLLDKEGIIKTKLKELKYRPLDKLKIKTEKKKWQIVNLLIPVLLLAVFFFCKQYLRQKSFI